MFMKLRKIAHTAGALLLILATPVVADPAPGSDGPNAAACPAAEPVANDPCPSHGLMCRYQPATCSGAQSDYDVLAICIHGEFSVRRGLSGC